MSDVAPPSASSSADAATRDTHTFPLAHLNGAPAPAPAWFDAALAAPRTDGVVEVEGARIAWRRWAPENRDTPKRGLVFVHGGLAHLGWWDFIAPFFTDAWTPMALSLSGMGASDHRDVYRSACYVAEVVAAARAGGVMTDAMAEADKPVLIGHSFGAIVSMAVAAAAGDHFGGAVLMDIPVTPPKVEGAGEPRRRGGRVYPTLADALARFRLMPDQECENLYLVDHVARGALHQVDGPDGAGWTWRHDPALWVKRDRSERFDPVALITGAQCPLAFVRGALSALVTDESWAFMAANLPAGAPMATVREARHHVLLDQPIATVAALEGLLAAWAPTGR